jgi:tetratricopeptide (TPR) repeat protein
VLYNPSSADHRALLGQAYLQAGRFHSAETAFNDALRLAPDHGRAALGLGLAQIALGKNDQALASLEQAHDRVPDADVGLAVALAGDRAGALAILEPAARASDASPKARQNLALTYALAGRWGEARTIASQDVSPDMLDKRMIEWSSFTRPRGTNEQVANLLGVKPVMDSGMPTELALIDAPAVSAPVAVAAIEPQPAPAEVIPAVTPVTEVAVAPEPVAPPSAIRPVDIAPPVFAEPAAPAPVQAAKPYFVKATAADALQAKPMYVQPVSAQPKMVAAVRPIVRSGGNFVVQLGAFSSQDRLERGWNNSLSKVSWLKDYAPVSTTFKSLTDGRSLHRLAISGFSSRIEAVNLCRKVRERGGICFVRGTAGDMPVQWVKRTTGKDQQYAAR